MADEIFRDYGIVVTMNPCLLHLCKNIELYVHDKKKPNKSKDWVYGTAGRDAIEAVDQVTSLLQRMTFEKHTQVVFQK